MTAHILCKVDVKLLDEGRLQPIPCPDQSRGNTRLVCGRINHAETPVGYVPGPVTRKLLLGIFPDQSRGKFCRDCARISHV